MGILDIFKKKKSSFDIIRERLLEDSKLAEFSGDWEKRQEISTQLLWMEFIKNKDSIIHRELKVPKIYPESSESYLNQTASEIKFPSKFDLEEILHYKFTERIIQEYGSVLANSGEYQKCAFKPESILPFPKEYITLAFQFNYLILKTEKPLFVISENREEIVKKLRAAEVYLGTFLKASKDELPSVIGENVRVGFELSKRK